MGELRILIGENKGLVAARLTAQLHSLGHHVVGVAKDGREVVASAWELQPDLIIVDARLPVMDGIEAARTILTRKAVPIILLTDYAAAGLIGRAREAGVMAYLETPADRKQLRSSIEAALAHFRELRALYREVSTLEEVFKTRVLVEQSKHVLMRWLKVPEAQAFRRMEQHSRNTRMSLKEIALRILKSDELLFRKPNVAQCLQVILDALRRAGVFLPTKAA